MNLNTNSKHKMFYLKDFPLLANLATTLQKKERETHTRKLLRRQEILSANQLLHTVPYGQNVDHTVVTLFDFMTLLLRPSIIFNII